MASLNFAAQVDAWTKETKQRMEAVFHKAAEMVGEAVVDGTPVDTGFLRHSFTASAQSMPTIDVGLKPAEGGAYAYDAGPVSLTIMSVPLGGTVFMGFTAIYSRRIEYGFVGEDSLGRTYNQQPRAMVGLAAQRWPEIVTAAVAQAKAAAAS